MKKKRIIIVVVLMLVFILGTFAILIFANDKKTVKNNPPLTKEEIKSFADKNHLTVIDREETSSAITYSVEIFKGSTNSVKVYILKDEETAKNAFNYYSDVYKANNKDNAFKETSNDSSYELTTDNYYYYAKYNKNLIIFTDCEIANKDEVKKIIKLFNY